MARAAEQCGREWGVGWEGYLGRQGPVSNSREGELRHRAHMMGCGSLWDFPEGFCLLCFVRKQMPLEGREGRRAGALRDERTSTGREPWNEVRTEAGT